MRQIIARVLPYSLKVQLHRVFDFFDDQARDPLLPPNWLHSVGGSGTDYTQSGEEYFQYFVDIVGLEPHGRVLDVGCGTGRMARPLTKYLKGGSYDGIDIVARSVRWCQKAYTPRHPNFHFHFTDIYNKAYNPAGKFQASEYRFPFEDASFDFVFLTSVFTHMLPPDMENYLSEVTRVLKRGGRCLITYFLLTPDSLKLIERKASIIPFDHEMQGAMLANRDIPEEAVAFDESRIRELYRKYELRISEPIRYGSWSGRADGLSFQDIVVAQKE